MQNSINYDPTAYKISDPVYTFSPERVSSLNDDPSDNYRTLIETKLSAGKISLPIVQLPLLSGSNRVKDYTPDAPSE